MAWHGMAWLPDFPRAFLRPFVLPLTSPFSDYRFNLAFYGPHLLSCHRGREGGRAREGEEEEEEEAQTLTALQTLHALSLALLLLRRRHHRSLLLREVRDGTENRISEKGHLSAKKKRLE